MTTERRNFDIPIHLLSNPHVDPWKPRKSQDPAEIARRANQRPGTLLYQQQAQAADVVKAVYAFPYTDPESRQFGRDWMAPALFNAAWYMYAHDKSTPDIVMRRTLSLARLATDKDGRLRATPDQMEDLAMTKMALISSRAHSFAVDYFHDSETLQSRRNLGRAMGDSALLLSALHLHAEEDVSAKDIMDVVFLEATNVQAAAVASHENLGVHATVTQLSDPLSPLSVAWKRQAPPEAKLALNEAQMVFGIPE